MAGASATLPTSTPSSSSTPLPEPPEAATESDIGARNLRRSDGLAAARLHAGARVAGGAALLLLLSVSYVWRSRREREREGRRTRKEPLEKRHMAPPACEGGEVVGGERGEGRAQVVRRRAGAGGRSGTGEEASESWNAWEARQVRGVKEDMQGVSGMAVSAPIRVPQPRWRGLPAKRHNSTALAVLQSGGSRVSPEVPARGDDGLEEETGRSKQTHGWRDLFLPASESATTLRALARGDGRLLLLSVEGADKRSLELSRRIWPTLERALREKISPDGVVALRLDIRDDEAAFWLTEFQCSWVTPVVAMAWGEKATMPLPRSLLASPQALLDRLDHGLERAESSPFCPRRAARMLGRLEVARQMDFPRPSFELPMPPSDEPLHIPLGGGIGPSAADLLAWQDAEFYAALAADQQAEAEAEAAQAAEAEAAEAAARAAEARVARAARKRAQEANLPPEPPEGAGVALVVVKLADGRRISRRFALETPLRQVEHWVGGATVDDGEASFFHLATNFPKRLFRGDDLDSLTVQSSGINGQMLLQQLEERDDDEDVLA